MATTSTSLALAVAGAAVWLSRTRRSLRDEAARLSIGKGEMLAYQIDGTGEGKLIVVNRPAPGPGEALIRVTYAGICNTDLELIKGYMGFEGTIGHEFVGVIEDFSNIMHPSDVDLVESFDVGQRVVGEINLACGDEDIPCEVCQAGGARARNHCPHRTVLGILNKNGTFAEYVTLPLRNLHPVPDSVPDEAAVLTEPLAAACRILEQGLVSEGDTVAVLGDGKLGLLICEAIGRFRGPDHCGVAKLTLVGKHPSKMTIVEQYATGVQRSSAAFKALAPNSFDVVVDATGSPAGLQDAMMLVRPLGTIVLKSTCAAGFHVHTAPLVIDEINVVGSRCGPFPEALSLLQGDVADVPNRQSKGAVTKARLAQPGVPLAYRNYVTRVFDFRDVEDAIDAARSHHSLKVLLKMPVRQQTH